MVILVVVSLITSVLIALAIWRFAFARPPNEIPVASAADEGSPFTSIIVPARNEESNIKRCVESLAQQDYPNFELIVVEDNSTDGTPAILAELAERFPQVRAIRGKSLPSGWVGKSFALHQGVADARGKWLLFTDADTYHRPQMLASVMNYAKVEGIDMLSLSPFQECISFWEKVIEPLLSRPFFPHQRRRRINDPTKKRAAANGQFILIRREVYEELGGHARIKNSIMEDLAMARLVKGQGYRLIMLSGRNLVRVRMYTNFRGICDGWSKTFFGILRTSLWSSVALILGEFCINMTPFLLLAISVIGVVLGWDHQFGMWFFLAQGLLQVCLVISIQSKTNSELGISPFWALSMPLGAAILAGIFFNSVFQGLTGHGARWKGRSYQLDQRAYHSPSPPILLPTKGGSRENEKNSSR